MRLHLRDTRYGNLVLQLGELPVFWANTTPAGQWYSTEEEARQAALSWFQHFLTTYRRDYESKQYALVSIKTLKAEAELDKIRNDRRPGDGN